jgi:hypothetical protein
LICFFLLVIYRFAYVVLRITYDAQHKMK